MRILLPLALSVLAIASSARAVEVALERRFELAPGERSDLAGVGIRVEFIGVLADSRCPRSQSVLCSWQGAVVARFEIADPTGPRRVDLSPPPSGHWPLPSCVHMPGVNLMLEAVEPHPGTVFRLRPSDYRARLRFTQHPPATRGECSPDAFTENDLSATTRCLRALGSPLAGTVRGAPRVPLPAAVLFEARSGEALFRLRLPVPQISAVNEALKDPAVEQLCPAIVSNGIPDGPAEWWARYLVWVAYQQKPFPLEE